MRWNSHVWALLLALLLTGCDKPAPQSAGPPVNTTGPVRSVSDLGRSFLAVVLNPRYVASPDDYVQIARDACAGIRICVVGMWDDYRRAPAALPMSRAHTTSQVFSYGKNEDVGNEVIRWNCDRFPAYRGRGCIPMPLPPP